MATQPEVDWRGEEVKAKLRAASIKAIDVVMSACVIHGKNNHPGWKNISTAAEGSIRVYQLARPEGSAVVGRWGSMNIDYMIWLEIKYGSALRSAASAKYPELGVEIFKALKSKWQ